jgi:CHAD domain-containing protein
MAHVTPTASGREARRLGLSSRMGRVLKELRRVRKSADTDAVHDLRVAIRRCRSVAGVVEEVDAHPAWQEMKKLPRKLFRTLGDLRDLQVLEQWVKRLASEDDPLRPRLLEALEARQATPRERVVGVADAFDREAWRRLVHTVTQRARLVPPNSLTAKCLVIERYMELRALHARAVRTTSQKPWHALRIGLKRFRYAVESLLPGRSAFWDEGLSQMQGLLGGIHDLDVLKAWIRQSGGVAEDSTESLRHAIEAERQSCIEQYRWQTVGTGGLLQVWKTGLMQDTTIAAATAARLRTTARAMDSHHRRTAAISRFALQIFDGLGTAGAERRFRDGRLRDILGMAAQLHAIRGRGRHKSRHKAARDILRAVPLPLGWKAQEWDLLTQVVRYHRGAEPAASHNDFRRLSREHRARVRGLAGVLRLARGLRRSGATPVPAIRADRPECVRLRVAGLKDTEENAARLAAAKHLLEVYLRRPILIEPGGQSARVRTLRLVSSSSRSI